MNAERYATTTNRDLCIENAKFFMVQSRRHRAIGEMKVAVFCLSMATQWRKKAAASLDS